MTPCSPALKICLEGLTAFLVVFNTTMGWDIHTGNPLWQAVRWVLPRSPVARLWVSGRSAQHR